MSQSSYTQENRPVRISTPMGDDVLLLRSMTGVERLGRPFEYRLVLLSESHELSYKDIVGQNVTVSVDKGDDVPRYFNGYVSRFSQTRYERKLAEYHATIVPWLWFLTRSADCRIFQNRTIPEILEQVFKDHGFKDFLIRLHGTYKPWEYCVQYRETAFNFVSRLMEQEGIYYFCKHQSDKHEVVLCDTPGSHLEFGGYEELHYHPERQHATTREIIWSWVEEHEIQPGTSSVKEFDFKNPMRSTVGSSFLDRGHAGGNLERFDYLGEMDAESDAERYTKLRLEEWQAEHEIYSGEGDARGICTGVRFKLRGHPRKDYEKEYLTTGTEFRIESDPFETVQQFQNTFVYEAKLTALPRNQVFRTPCITQKPEVSGPQTAIVVGPKGEEIYTDKYGRVKVQFHWDRYGAADENSSCWLRVAQGWAGKKWGAIWTPRVGQEVIVDFLEGDPNRPIVIGRVYNERSQPPYPLPANKTISTIKSQSSKGGDGFNEIRFEDKKGEEQVFIHAEKDQDQRIKHDVKEWVGNDRHLIVKKDQFESVEGSKHSSVKGDLQSKVEGEQGETIKGDRLVAIDGADNLTVKGDQKLKVGGEINLKGEKALNCEAGAKLSLKAGADFHAKAAQNYAVDAGQNLHLKAAQNLVIEAGMQLSLKVGGNFVDIGPAGVAINGTMVMINSGGSPASGSGSSPTAAVAPDAPDPPKSAAEAAKADPGQKDEPPPAPAPPKPVTYSSAALVLKAAAQDGTPFCEECTRAAEEEAARKSTWIELQLVGEDGKPIPDEPYRVMLPDGTAEEGTLDDSGKARVEGFEKGNCKVTFPNLDQEAWEEA